MDIHRSRFVPVPSPPINAIAFSRSNDKGLLDPKPALKLAIGRADGTIEIWNPNSGHWVQEVVFPGDAATSIDGLVWTQEPDDHHDDQHIAGQLRLFSIASTAAVTERDLKSGRPLRVSTGNFSEAWCIAAQPREPAVNPSKADDNDDGSQSYQHIIVGCGDGALALLSTAENDLVFKRFMARSGSKRTRCMSVIWQNHDRVVAGFNDSTIRVYDTRNGSLIRNMSMGAGIPGAPKDTLVWRVKCLPNEDIVSADSNGQVRFWNGKTYALSQRVSGHSSDCLELVTSTDGQVVFSGGLDGRLAAYRLSGRNNERRHWAKIAQRQLHKGDIKSMATYDSKAMSVVVSGGHDASPTFTPLRDYGRSPHRRISGLRHTPTCLSVPSQRLLLCWWEQSVYIWRIGRRNAAADSTSLEHDTSRQLVSRIMLKGDASITSVAAAASGRLVVVSTAVATKAFRLVPAQDESQFRLRVSTIALPSSLAETGARLVDISPNGRWLSVITVDNEVHVARIDTADGTVLRASIMSKTVELERENHKYSLQSGLGTYEANITRSAFSLDSSVLVVGDLSGYLDTWVLLGHYDSTAPAMETAARENAASADSAESDSGSSSDDEDEDVIIFYGQHWSKMPSGAKLPKLESAPLVLSFRPVAGSTNGGTGNGNPGIHPTRQNPHAHSHAVPTARSILFTMTQSHRVYEFDVLTGGLTDWSRRNPSSSLPASLNIIQDRVKGLVWEVRPATKGSVQHERAWLYGATWLAMLDVSQNFSSREPVSAKRRASDAKDGQRKRRRISGVREGETGGLITSVRKTEQRGGEDIQSSQIAVDEAPDLSDQDSSDQDEKLVGPLLTRLNHPSVEAAQETTTTKRRKWWSTFKYKPILGIVPISAAAENVGDEVDDDVQDAAAAAPMEIVLVERPDWDLPQLRDLKDDHDV